MLSPLEKLFCFCWLKIEQFFCADSDDFLMEAQVYYMYSYEQLLVTLNQQNATDTFITQQAAMIYNMRSERQNTTRGTRKISKESHLSREVAKDKRTQFNKYKVVSKVEGVGRRYQTKAH